MQNTLYDSHEQAACQLGLVQDSEKYILAFQEARTLFTPRELRQLLLTVVTSNIAGAPAWTLWDKNSTHLTPENPVRMSNFSATDHALRHADLMLSNHGKSTASVGLPTVIRKKL